MKRIVCTTSIYSAKDTIAMHLTKTASTKQTLTNTVPPASFSQCVDERIVSLLDWTAPLPLWNGMVVHPMRPKSNGDFYTGGFTSLLCSNPRNLSLYQYTPEGELYSYGGHYKTTIGLALDERRNIFYHLDSCTDTLTALDYDPNNGRLCKAEWNICWPNFVSRLFEWHYELICYSQPTNVFFINLIRRKTRGQQGLH